MRTIYLTGALAATILLAACGEKAPNADGADANTASTNAADAGVGGDDPSAAKAVKSSGTVTSIDQAARKITLAHEPIPEVNWPAMTMGFSVEPEVLGTVKVGDKVTFDAKIIGNLGEITALARE